MYHICIAPPPQKNGDQHNVDGGDEEQVEHSVQLHGEVEIQGGGDQTVQGGGDQVVHVDGDQAVHGGEDQTAHGGGDHAVRHLEQVAHGDSAKDLQEKRNARHAKKNSNGSLNNNNKTCSTKFAIFISSFPSQ